MYPEYSRHINIYSIYLNCMLLVLLKVPKLNIYLMDLSVVAERGLRICEKNDNFIDEYNIYN